MNSWHDIETGKRAPEIVNTVIEISKGSRLKYELHKDSGMMMLDRVAHTTNVYPGDYGFIPQTYWEDGDPLDILVIGDTPVLPNTLAQVRVIGVMHMIDGGESDDKVIGVYEDDPRYDDVNTLEDIARHRLDEIQHYFESYKDLQNTEVTVTGFEDVSEARNVVEKGIRLYKEKF